MKELLTKKGDKIICDAEDYNWIKANMPYYVTNRGVLQRARRHRDPEYYKGTLIQLTREILGFAPQEYRVLHINNNKLDVCKENIKFVLARNHPARRAGGPGRRPSEQVLLDRKPINWRNNILKDKIK